MSRAPTRSRDAVQAALRRFGVDIVRYPMRGDPLSRRARLLEAAGVNLVFDVGANDGGYAKRLREIGYRGQIVSFEPQRTAFTRLQEAASKDPLWITVRCALGDNNGDLDLFIAANSVSSSPRKMLEAHMAAAPDSQCVGVETVPVARLDDLIGEYLEEDSVPFLKIDTQGYEDSVLRGAAASLTSIVGLQIELSLVPLYEGQVLWREMVDRIEAQSFQLCSLEPGFADSVTGRMLQFDGVFFTPECVTLR
jgi:FkbM family methyltransferase